MGERQIARGYQLADFEDAWRRHMGIEMRKDPDGRYYPVNLAMEHAAGQAASEPPVTPEHVTQEQGKVTPGKSEIAAIGAVCNGVAPQTPEIKFPPLQPTNSRQNGLAVHRFIEAKEPAGISNHHQS
jgi:hypothetical protein